jgi:hypothetical protein
MSMQSTPDFAVIEVAGYGMRVRLTMDRDKGVWFASGWANPRGQRVMTVFGSCEGLAPWISDEDEGPGVQVGSTFIGLPPPSLEKLAAFIASVQGKTAQAVAA